MGNEPGWNLEIQAGSRIVLVADYGASRVELPLPQPTVDRDTGTGELLCLGISHQPGYRAVLERLAALAFVAEIHEAFFE